MISASRLAKVLNPTFVVIVFLTLVLFSQVSHSNTYVNIDFDESSDLVKFFNPDSATHVFSRATGGIGDSGAIDSSHGQNVVDVWTSKIAYSVNGPGDSYRLSSYYRISDASGYSGLGIATNSVNEPVSRGYTSSGIGYIATDSTVSILSTTTSSPTVDRYDFQLNQFSTLQNEDWYQFDVAILTNDQNTFDVSILISESDSDNDGQLDIDDEDDDNDGVEDADDVFPELASESRDSDGDGTGDVADLDDDNDGVSDELDAFPNDAGESRDSDADGIANNKDTDDDNDGYSDAIELLYESLADNANSTPNDLDMDRDTLADALERGIDTDGDGIGNEFDVDSDNDGIFDLIEASPRPALAAATDINNDGMMDNMALINLPRITAPVDTDRDGIHNFMDMDSDNDGISDAAETASVDESFLAINTVQQDANSKALADPDGDGLVNHRDLDSDNDGIPDLVEAGGEDVDANGITDNFFDNNDDGMDDSLFSLPLILADTDRDGQQDYIDLDSNDDGQFDIVTSGFVNADLDGDGRVDIGRDANANGISDYADVAITNGVDSDNDGIDDRVDATVLDEPDSDSDGIADRYDADSQGDGFIEFSTVKIAAINVITTTTPVVSSATPETESTQEQTTIVASTAIDGGGCSIASTGHPDITITALLVFATIYLMLLHIGTFKTIKRFLLIFLSTSLAAGPVIADVRTGLYLGIGGGASRLMPGVENISLDNRDSVGMAWNAMAGYHVTPSFDVELEYANLGTTTLDPIGSIDYQDMNVSGLYHLGGAAHSHNGKNYSVYGRLGVGRINNQSNIKLERGSSAHWLAGLGVQVPVSNRLSVRAEGVNYDTDVSRVGISLKYQLGRMQGLSPKAQVDDSFAANKDTSEVDIQSAKTDTADAAGVPYYLSASRPEPYRFDTPTVEQLMATDPDPKPKTRWLISEGAMQRRQAPTPVNSAMDNRLLDLAASTERDSVATSVVKPEVVAVVVPEMTTSAQPQTTTTVEPEMNAALPMDLADDAPDKVEASSELESESVYFGFDQSNVLSSMQDKLQPLVNTLKSNPDLKVVLTGHTDNTGPAEYNDILSLRRAEAVRKFLLQQGIDRKMIRVLGAGEKRPIKSNAKPSGRRANRRVSIEVE